MFITTLLLLVPQIGLEPIRREAGDFESPVSTNFTTKAFPVYRS